MRIGANQDDESHVISRLAARFMRKAERCAGKFPATRTRSATAFGAHFGARLVSYGACDQRARSAEHRELRMRTGRRDRRRCWTDRGVYPRVELASFTQPPPARCRVA